MLLTVPKILWDRYTTICRVICGYIRSIVILAVPRSVRYAVLVGVVNNLVKEGMSVEEHHTGVRMVLGELVGADRQLTIPFLDLRDGRRQSLVLGGVDDVTGGTLERREVQEQIVMETE